MGVGLFAVLAGLSLIPGILAGQALQRGRDAVGEGRRALLALREGSKAEESFAVASAAFREATRWAENPLVRLEGLIPIIGRTPDAVARLAQAGERIATAGSALSQGVSAIPGGLTGLAPRSGRIPMKAVRTLAPAVAKARAELEAGQLEVRPISTSWVVPPVSDATTLVRGELAEALRLIRAADSILSGMPELAGVNGRRRYYIAAQNPAELRGTGGIIGLYSIMTIEDGRIHIGPFIDTPPPNAPPDSIEGPPGYGPPYTGFGSPWSWLNTNAVPDAPTVAEMIEALWQRVMHQRLDGVIFVTPQALQSLIGALGPIEIPELDYTVTAENVVNFTTNDSFFLFNEKQYLRNRAYGIVAKEVLDRFFAASRPKKAVEALVHAASSGYLIMHAADPAVQEGFAEARIDGRFSPEGRDFFSVVANNIAGNKVDYYLDSSIDYQVALQPDGSSSATATVTLHNTAPSRKGHQEALGPFPVHRRSPKGLQLSSGEDYLFLTFYCSATCEGGITESGKAKAGSINSSLPGPTQVLATQARLRSKEERNLVVSMRTKEAWVGDHLGGTYRLRLQGQPTIRSISARVALRLPAGMRIASTNVPISFDGETLVWEGTLGRVQDIFVRFERPPLERLWTMAKDFFNRPVFRIG